MPDETKQNKELVDQKGEGVTGEIIISANNLAIILKHYREKVKHMSLRELADAAQLSTAYLSRLEREEKRNPSIAVLARISDALDIPFSVLLATAVHEKESRDQLGFAEILLMNDYSINGIEISNKAKSLLVQLNEYLISCEWSGQSKFRDIFAISEKVDELKQAL